jgi:hypothetical protein
MKRILLLALLCAAASSTLAQSFITMGRLFTTPSERAQLDSLRNSGASALPGATLPGASGPPGGAGASTPMPGMPGASAGAAQGGAQGAESATPPQPADVQLSGIIRRSGGGTTVFVNGEPQEGRPVDQGKAARVQIEGRTIVLKPGQTYDPATGEIRESGR